MGSSLLASIHNAFVGPADDVLNEDETTGAETRSTTGNKAMSKDNSPVGGETSAGMVSQSDHQAAVTAARAEGEKAATTRLSAALGAEAIKGDAGRMTAAMDLAGKSPSMSGEDVAAFVSANVAASSSAKTTADKYSEQRSAAASLAQPSASASAKKPSINAGGIYAKRRQQEG